MTTHLTLRPLQLDDLDPLAAMWADPDVTRYLPTGLPRSRERTQTSLTYFINHWQQHGFGVWAVLLKETDSFIGYAGLQYSLNSSEVEVLYGLAKPYWGQGLAFEAAQAALRYGFETLQLPRIIGMAFPANVASCRILEKLGLKLTTELPQNYGPELNYYLLKREDYR
jgi:ribosomal-protein-alanine N-acetyltransferase